MKKIILALAMLFIACGVSAQQTFEMKRGDTTLIMQEYYVVYLVAGDAGDHDSARRG